jgi:hypothetical protein
MRLGGLDLFNRERRDALPYSSAYLFTIRQYFAIDDGDADDQRISILLDHKLLSTAAGAHVQHSLLPPLLCKRVFTDVAVE